MPQRLLAGALSDMAQIMARLAEAVGRMEANQQTIMHSDRNSYLHIRQSLTETQRELAVISERQTSFKSYGDTLGRIEGLMDYALSLIHQMLSDHGRSLGRLEANFTPPRPPLESFVSKLIEIAPKIAANWAPISAAAVAIWKWGIPYLRAFLG